MGAGIAQVCATSGLRATLVDVAEKQLEKACATIGESLGKLVSKEKLTQDEADSAVQRIDYVTSFNRPSDADLVIESAVENEKTKGDIFSNLEEVLQPEGVIATNTSSISITRLASYTNRAERFIGMHFMNPGVWLLGRIRGTQLTRADSVNLNQARD